MFDFIRYSQKYILSCFEIIVVMRFVEQVMFSKVGDCLFHLEYHSTRTLEGPRKLLILHGLVDRLHILQEWSIEELIPVLDVFFEKKRR